MRSNDENKIGFLHRLNRQCVGQLKAKCGIYFISNHNMFKEDPNWLQLLYGMHKSECLGSQITVQCPFHQDSSKVQAGDANDIKRIHVLHGLCKEQCSFIHSCGKRKCKEHCGSNHKHKRCKANMVTSSQPNVLKQTKLRTL